MKINTGNFGQQVANLTPESVQHREVNSVAQAQMQGAAQVGAAGQNLGNTIAQVGADLKQHYTRMARLDAQQRVADYSQYQQETLDSIDAQVQQGQLDSKGAAAVYAKAMAEKKKEFDSAPILDLDSEGKAFLDKGISSAAASGAHRMGNYISKLAWGEADRKLDQTAAQFGQMAQQGVPLQTALQAVDQFYNDNAAHYGPAAVEQKKGAMRRQVITGNFRYRIEQAQDHNGQLAELKQEALQSGMDDTTLASINTSIDTKISRNEARAQAAQNHRDAVATRREVAAVHADDQMQKRIASGEVPSEEDWQVYDSKTHGTSVGGKTAALQQSSVITQSLLKENPVVAQQALDARRLELQKSGGSSLDWDVLNNTQRAIDARKADLKSNPQSVAAMDSGQPLEPVTPSDAIDNPGQMGAALQQRLVNSDALRQKYGATAAKSLLTSDEMNNTKDYYAKLTSDQRVQFWRNINASAGSTIAGQLARDIGGDSLTVSAIASAANTPAGYASAVQIEKGTQLLNPVDGSAKARAPKQQDVTDLIKRKYPGLTPDQVQRAVPVVTAAYVGQGGDPESFRMTEDQLSAVLGEPTKVMGAQLVAPIGMSSEVFRDKITSQVNRLPGDQSAYVRNHLDNGTYTFVPDSAGNLRLINKDTNRVVTIGGKPFMVGME